LRADYVSTRHLDHHQPHHDLSGTHDNDDEHQYDQHEGADHEHLPHNHDDPSDDEHVQHDDHSIDHDHHDHTAGDLQGRLPHPHGVPHPDGEPRMAENRQQLVSRVH